MSNIFSIKGNPEKEELIKDMKTGESGYTVEWAYDSETQTLNEDFSIDKKGGTGSLKVICVQPGTYSLKFEKPIYRDILTGKFG